MATGNGAVSQAIDLQQNRPLLLMLTVTTGFKTDFMYIHVFKTNLNDTRRINDIESSLDMHPDIIEWNVDLNDSDNILRVVSHIATPERIEQVVLSAGYYCEELV